uniref:Uncharacterized protein n=1 Tax=Arundo donax TaxID=35708 RepID=A0A0A9ESX1_ARUDO
MSLAIRLVLTGNQKTEDNTSLESIILPIVKALDHAANDLRSYHHLLTSSISFGCPETDSYYDRCQIGYIGDRINYDVPEILIHMVKTFVSWRNLPSFIPNYEVVTYDTFLEKFLPNGRTDDGFFALDNCLNISSFCATDHFDIEDARFFLFSRFEQVVEMLDLCIKFAEGISFSQESCPPTGRCDAISLSRFLRNKGFSLETSYGLVGLCLKKQCQPGELTPQQLQGVGFPCDSLEDIHEARSLLQGKQIVFDNSLTNHDSLLAKLLFWCYNLEMEPQVFC